MKEKIFNKNLFKIYQYLLTLYHEINNPINSLLSILSEMSGIKNIKRIELLIF